MLFINNAYDKTDMFIKSNAWNDGVNKTQIKAPKVNG